MTSTAGRPGRSWKKILLWAIGVAVVVFLLIQLVPYGRSSHSNPPATNPFQWTDPQAEAIARESCYDCHSNETEWWWATNIAPFSWLVQRDVDGGRAEFNFSEWDGQPSVEAIRRSSTGEMPPFQYTLIHPGAKLTDAEKQTLRAGLRGRAWRRAAVRLRRRPRRRPRRADLRLRRRRRGDHQPALQHLHLPPSRQSARVPRRAAPPRRRRCIDDMIRRGAQVTTEEQQALVQYFTQ